MLFYQDLLTFNASFYLFSYAISTRINCYKNIWVDEFWAKLLLRVEQIIYGEGLFIRKKERKNIVIYKF